MQSRSDAELLEDYARNGSDLAFGEIVERHTDLVYSAALRQVGAEDIAHDITQNVFADLARKAVEVTAKLTGDQALVGWLYRGTRFAALQYLRGERRRVFRERQLMQESDPPSDETPAWDQLKPVLDEAMDQLADSDRTALLLRYFKKQDFRAVGAALGVSDDTAQKRVARALEKLRGHLASRGIGSSAAGLAALLGGHAVQAAPPGLAALISAAGFLSSSSAVSTSAVIATSKAIAMTTAQRTLIATTLAVAIGTGIYETQQASRLAKEVRRLEQAAAPQAEQLRRLQDDYIRATSALSLAQQENSRWARNSAELLKLRGEVTQLRKDSDELARIKAADRLGEENPTEAEMKLWLARADQLKQQLQGSSGFKHPEFQLLTEQDWLNASRGRLETEEDWRQAMSSVRGAAESKFVPVLQEALKKYYTAHNNQFPKDLSELQAYFKEPVDQAVLERYDILPSDAIPNVGVGGESIVTQKEPVDRDYDFRVVIGPFGTGSTQWKHAHLSTAFSALEPALKSYRTDHEGREPSAPSDIEPYLKTAAQKEAYHQLLKTIEQ